MTDPAALTVVILESRPPHERESTPASACWAQVRGYDPDRIHVISAHSLEIGARFGERMQSIPHRGVNVGLGGFPVPGARRRPGRGPGRTD